MTHKAAVIIPARYGSSRFPGKVLASIQSKPLIQWIYDAARRSRLAGSVIIATDDMRIYEAVEGFGGDVVMTSSRPRTGSDRCAEVAEKLEEEMIINLQADELLKGPEMLDELISMLIEDPSIKMGTLKREIISPEELWDRNVVKVVTDNNDYALYFSRSPIPHIRDRVINPSIPQIPLNPPLLKGETWGLNPPSPPRSQAPAWERKSVAKQELSNEKVEEGFLGDEERLPRKTFYKHLGIYAYRRDFLLLFSALPTTKLEDLEKLEQLRAIESGFRIKVKETGDESCRIDTPSDLERIAKLTIGN